MSGYSGQRIRILIVENDEDEREFMKEGFDATGKFELLAMFRNGDQLLDWMKKNPDAAPDVVLSDLNMPGKNGYDIIEHLRREQSRSIPVIITSTSTTRSIINRCLEMGAAEYIVKPDTFIEYQPFAEQLYQLILQKKLVSR